MKLTTLTAAVLMTASAAFAGNMTMEAADAAPMVEMAPMADDHGSAGSMGGLGWLLPLVVIGAIVAASED